MSDLEREMEMLQGMDLSGTVAPVQAQQVTQVVPVQTTQTIVQPVTPVAPVAPVQTTVTAAPVAPVQNNVSAPLNLDVAQENIDNNEFVTVDMGQKVSSSVIEKFKGQKDEKKRVAILMPWFDDANKAGKSMAIKRHYDEDLGSFICFGGECCQYSGTAAIRYLFPVIEYPIANNDATKPLPENYGECKLKLLVAGNELYTNLCDIYQAHGNSFDGYDLIMTCTEQQYQSFTVMATNQSVKTNYQSFNKCIEKWKQVRSQAYTAVARKMDQEYYKNQKGLNYQGSTTPIELPTMDAMMQ